MRLRSLLLFLIVLTSAGASNARAQLLYSGGEDIDFICNSSGSCTVDTNNGSYRSAWARESYGVLGSNSDPPSNRFATPAFSAISTLWVHGQFCVLSGNSGSGCGNIGTNSSYQMLRVFDSAGNPTLVLVGTGTGGQVTISSRSTSGVFTILATCSSALTSSLAQLDLYINYGTSGQVTLYSNSVQVCSYTGNVTNGDGATTLNQAEFASPANTWAMWSEIIIASSDTRAMARFTANTAGDGNTTGFSSTSGDICSSIWNATSFSDSSYGYSGSTSVLHECTINHSIPLGNYSVVGLVMSARALVGSSGPQHFEFLTRVSGTDYPSSNFAPTNSFSNITNYIQTVNPATSNPWAVSDFQASGFNVGEETQP